VRFARISNKEFLHWSIEQSRIEMFQSLRKSRSKLFRDSVYKQNRVTARGRKKNRVTRRKHKK